MLPLLHDIRIIAKLLKPVKGKNHADRLESFYAGQADGYDEFRKKLLPGRENLMEKLPDDISGVWVDLGCGTGSNLEILDIEVLRGFKKIYLVDLSKSLLEEAQKRVARLGLTNVEIVEGDVCRFKPTEAVDLVTFSYSLTMIPHWFAALTQAKKILKKNGYLGIVDFYVSEKFPETSLQYHSGWTRHFWRVWFSWDNVFLSSDHLPFLRDHFEQKYLYEGRHAVPYMPAGKVPYYVFIGQQRAES